MLVAGVRTEVLTGQCFVLLREDDGDRALPIWIGENEARAIVAAEGDPPPRPMTHDLMVALLATMGHDLEKVVVTAVSEGVFRAELHLSGGITVDSRPSDAIALAVRTGASVWCAEEVLEESAVTMTEEAGEVERFREFLRNVSAEDFEFPPET